MPIIVLTKRPGFQGRVPVAEEQKVLHALTVLDPDIKHTVPIGFRLDGINYLIVWRDL